MNVGLFYPSHLKVKYKDVIEIIKGTYPKINEKDITISSSLFNSYPIDIDKIINKSIKLNYSFIDKDLVIILRIGKNKPLNYDYIIPYSYCYLNQIPIIMCSLPSNIDA
jgi:hypothetical protein